MADIDFNAFADNPELNPLMEVINEIMKVPEESLTEETIDVIEGMIKGVAYSLS